MKKMLSMLGSLGLVATGISGTASTVSCNNEDNTVVDTMGERIKIYDIKGDNTFNGSGSQDEGLDQYGNSYYGGFHGDTTEFAQAMYINARPYYSTKCRWNYSAK